jgi:hypothetical protein
VKVTPLLVARRDLKELEMKFRGAGESYEELRATCEARVARWEWATGDVYSMDPLFFLDSGIRTGHVSSSPPDNPARWVAYGFTVDDRIVVERAYTELPSQKFYQGFYIELSDRIVGYRYHYSSDRTPINCSQLVIEGSSPAYFQRWASRGWVSYTYACTGARIDSFVAAAKQEVEPESRFSGEVVYKEGGAVELWTKEQGRPKAELSFRGKPPAENPFVRGWTGR